MEILHFGCNIGLEAMPYISYIFPSQTEKQNGFLKIVEGALEGGTKCRVKPQGGTLKVITQLGSSSYILNMVCY